MKPLHTIIITTAIIIMTGCAGTSSQIEKNYTYNASDTFTYKIFNDAKISAKGSLIFKQKLDIELAKIGLSSAEKANKKIDITVQNYRMRPGAARALVGIFAGTDNMTSEIIIKDSATGEVLGELQVVSKNPTAWGTSKGLIEQHADEIVAFIKNEKK